MMTLKKLVDNLGRCVIWSNGRMAFFTSFSSPGGFALSFSDRGEVFVHHNALAGCWHIFPWRMAFPAVSVALRTAIMVLSITLLQQSYCSLTP